MDDNKIREQTDILRESEKDADFITPSSMPTSDPPTDTTEPPQVLFGRDRMRQRLVSRSEPWRARHPVIAFILNFLKAVLFPILAGYIMINLINSDFLHLSNYNISFLLSQSITTLLVVATLMVLTFRDGWKETLGFKLPTYRQAAVFFAIMLAMLFVVPYIEGLFFSQAEMFENTQWEKDTIEFEMRNVGHLFYLFFTIIIIAPFAEEFLFRSSFFGYLNRTFLRNWPTIIIAAEVWALLHGQYNTVGMIDVFINGILIGYARVKTGSLFLPIALHMANNGLECIRVLYFV